LTRYFFKALLAFLLPSPLVGQSFVFDHTRLRLGVDSMSITLVRDGQEIAVGELWDDFALDSAGSTPRMRRIYRTVNEAFGPHLDTTFVYLPGLQPSQRRTRSQIVSDSVVAEKGHLSGWYQHGNQSATIIDRQLEPTVIDGSFFDAAVRAAPLAQGYRLTLVGYSPGHNSLLTLSVEVTGEEQIAQRDGQTVQVWVVRMDFGGLPSTMWIAQVDRSMVRQTIDLAPNVQMLMRR